MDKSNERERAYENKFIHDAEIEFKITARTNKYIGLWAAEIMSFDTDNSNKYAKSLIDYDIDQHNERGEVIKKLQSDFASNNINIDAKLIISEYDNFKNICRNEIITILLFEKICFI